uniref:Thioredoxin domain-containing protein n=1 Tax=Ditylum brightwellii TaxID=49249 RepID=A0A7S4RQX7_9STRA
MSVILTTFPLFNYDLSSIINVLNGDYRCEYSKALKPDWEKLAEVWSGDENTLIAEVDCNDDAAQFLCYHEEIQGYPTLKYGNPKALLTYFGESLSYDDLAAFAKANLKPVCGLNNMDLCLEEKKALIESLMAMSKEELEQNIENDRLDKKLFDEMFNKEAERLSREYEELIQAKEDRLKADSLGLLTAVLSWLTRYQEVMNCRRQEVMNFKNKYPYPNF